MLAVTILIKSRKVIHPGPLKSSGAPDTCLFENIGKCGWAESDFVNLCSARMP